jgi:hypothetical protein
MNLSQFIHEIFLFVIGGLGTVFSIVYVHGKYRGKTEALTEQVNERHAEILKHFHEIDSRLDVIEDRAHITDNKLTEVKTTLSGADGRNGVRGMVYDIHERLKTLESR